MNRPFHFISRLLPPVCAVAVALGAGSSLADTSAANDAVLVPGSAGIYGKSCAYCHDHEGVAPVILGRELPALAVAAIVRSGIGAMPAFRITEINQEELTALADWVQRSPVPAQ